MAADAELETGADAAVITDDRRRRKPRGFSGKALRIQEELLARAGEELLARAAIVVPEAERVPAALPRPGSADGPRVSAHHAATLLAAQRLVQLQASRKLNSALTRMLQHEQARTHRLELELEAERKGSAAQRMEAAHTTAASSDKAAAAVAEAKAAEAAGAARRALAAVADAREVEDDCAQEAAAFVADAESAEAAAGLRTIAAGHLASLEEGEEEAEGDARPVRFLRRLLRAAPPSNRPSSAAAAASAPVEDGPDAASTCPEPTHAAPSLPQATGRRPLSAGFLLKRGANKPLRLGMIIPTGCSASPEGRSGTPFVPRISTPAPFEWPEDIASPAPRKIAHPGLFLRHESSSPRTPSHASPSRLQGGGGGGGGLGGVFFSGALSGRMQSELQAELLRLQDETQQLIEGCAAGGFGDEAGNGGASIGPAVRALSRRLGWLRSDLGLLRQMAPSREHRTEASRLGEVALAAEEFARSLRGELANDRNSGSEDWYVDALEESGLSRVAVARDGNCLFGCAAVFLNRAAPQPSGGAAAHTALSLRLAAVAALRGALARDEADGALGGVGVLAGGVGERIDAAIADAMCSGASDASTVALRRRLGRREGGARQSIGGSEAREVYLELVATEGVFGERLEIEALASVLRAPMFMYYSLERLGAGGEADAALRVSAADGLPAPVEVIEPNPKLLPQNSPPASPHKSLLAFALPDSAAAATAVQRREPLRLLHLVAARHFDLLLTAD